MDCAEEIAVLRREIGPLVGGEEHLGFDLLNGRMTVLASAPAIPASAVMSAVARTGMKAERWESGVVAAPSFLDRNGRLVAVAASAIGTVAGFAIHAAAAGDAIAALGSEGMGAADGPPLAARIVYGVAIAAALWLVLPKAWFAVRRLRPDMNLLMTLAVAGALFIGEWLEAATVSLLFAVSLLLEAWSVGRARRAVEALMSLEAPSARVQRGGHEVDVRPDEVELGERIAIRPGERVPLDGRVIEGASSVNQAPITGESVPVTKEAGADVFAGTINGDGALVVEVTHTAGDTTLARIVRMVSDAQARRSPAELWVEKFAAFYTPAILASATLLAVVPPLAFAEPFDVWLYRGLVLLVIGCPCSLVISTPVTIVAAIASAARHGVLLKGGPFVEAPSRVRAIALDKTGTLTEGRPRVVRVEAMSGHDERELLLIAHALEQRSDHPLAKAIVAHAEDQGVRAPPATSFEILQGKGAAGTIDGTRYWLGSHRYLEGRGQETADVHEELERLTLDGRSVVVLGNDEHVCGFFALADGVRPESKAAVAAMREAGVERIVMLTGDNRGAADIVARETGVDEVRAELLPADKVAAVEELVREHGAVAMVGDGVNDAPALARATFGIAMGAAGTDVALETADVALMSDDLSKIAWLIRHSRRAMGIVRQNIAFSLGVKALFVILALVGISSLWMAIAADMGASLIVTFNGLRLLADREKPR